MRDLSEIDIPARNLRCSPAGLHGRSFRRFAFVFIVWSKRSIRRGLPVSKATMSWGRWCGYCILCLLLLATTSVAQARACRSDAAWSFTENSLQNARARVKSNAHKSAVSRVQCGQEIIEAIGGPEKASQCDSCIREYVGLLLDVISYTREAVKQSESEANKKLYYDYQIETRLLFGRFILDTQRKNLVAQYWRDNFEGLGDAAESAKLGERFHREASLAAQEQMLSLKSFRTWAKAVRSCKAWNFVESEKRDLPMLQRILLCTEDCRAALTRIRNRAARSQGIDRENIEEELAESLPALGNCPEKDNQ